MTAGSVHSAPAEGGGPEVRLHRACHQLEAVFLTYVLRAMREASAPSDTATVVPERELFEQLFDARLAERVSERTARGLADALFAQLRQRLTAEPAR